MKTLAISLAAILAVIAVARGETALPLAESLSINGIEVQTKAPPAGLVLREKLGLLTVDALNGQVVHRTTTRILETRATITPGGDYLLLFPEGDHYAKSKGEKMNTMMAYRSSDKGQTWQGPTVAFDIPYSQHGFIPLIPRGSKRIYAFGTQPIPGQWTHVDGQRENAPIGYRWSDDDGRTWSDVTLISPANDPEFRGMSVMRMTETDAGTWLLGSHLADWSVKPFKTRQYLLRSEDQGRTWTVLPGARPDGWIAPGFERMDEGRPLNLGGGRVLFMARTPAGKLFTAWSKDDGKTWTNPAPSSLVHPDAPPMVFPLSDGKTLVAFHHNKVPPAKPQELSDHAETMKVRSEIWAATSTDEGHTWSEPRFVFANAVQPVHKVGGFNFQCSYLDMFVEDGVLHIFLPHRWQQVLHLTLKESALATLPTKADLQRRRAAAEAEQRMFRIENQTILTSGDILTLTQSRAAMIPGNPPRVLLTTQETERVGAHGYRDLLSTESTDLGQTWSAPERIEALRRTTLADGYDFVIGDVCPQWHAATGTVLATGKTFGFREGKIEDRSRERVSYSVYAPQTRRWSGLQLLELPARDHEGKPMLEANAGCHQRFDLPNGEVLLPIRYRKDPKTRQYTTIVARCSFDGKQLSYGAHGSELTIASGRGLYEPSVTAFQGRYFLTMRADHSAFVARSKDGLNYEPKVEWKFDDGKLLGSYNTQQHWVAHGDALYLVYTRRDAGNDHIMRHRAPLFIARVDPERLCVRRDTERILIPENGADLGNFGVVDLGPKETWIVTSESLGNARFHEPNRVLLARIVWSQPNDTVAAKTGSAIP